MFLILLLTDGDSDNEQDTSANRVASNGVITYNKPFQTSTVRRGDDSEESGEDAEEEDVMAIMGFGGFDTTKVLCCSFAIPLVIRL